MHNYIPHSVIWQRCGHTFPFQVLGFIRVKPFLFASSNPTGWESGCSCPRCLTEPYPATCFGGSSLSCTVRRASTWRSSALLCNLLTANEDSKVEFLHSEPMRIDLATAVSATGLILCRFHC